MRYTTRFTLALGLVGSVAFAGAAMAGTRTPRTLPDADPSAVGFAFRGPGGPAEEMAGQMLHGEQSILLEDGTVATMTDDAGTITAIDGSTVSIERADGSSLEVRVIDEAMIVRNGEEAALGDLAVDDLVNVHQATGFEDGDRMHVFARTADWEPEWKPFPGHGRGRFLAPAPDAANRGDEEVVFIGEDVAA